MTVAGGCRSQCCHGYLLDSLAAPIGFTRHLPHTHLLRNLSKDVFERRTSSESKAFSLFTCLDDNKFVLLTFFCLIKTIYQSVSTKPLLNDAKRPLLVDVRRSKMLLLNLT